MSNKFNYPKFNYPKINQWSGDGDLSNLRDTDDVIINRLVESVNNTAATICSYLATHQDILARLNDNEPLLHPNLRQRINSITSQNTNSLLLPSKNIGDTIVNNKELDTDTKLYMLEIMEKDLAMKLRTILSFF